MEQQWLTRWWGKVEPILRHPWHSLVSLFTLIGEYTLKTLHVLTAAARWLWRQVLRIPNIPLRALAIGLAFALVALCVVGTLLTIFLINYPTTRVPDFQPVDQHVYLSQGWGWTGGENEPLRQIFYYTPQGAGVKDLRYSWFVHLEVPWGTTRFADPQRMSAYGFLVDSVPSPLNPDRLPVGFTSHYDARFGENVLDLTCAACHTGELTVNKNGKRYGLRIDGGPAMHAFTAMHVGDFGPELLGSLTATYLNPFKYARFARAVLGPAYPQSRWKLHHDLGTVIAALARQSWNDKSRHLYPTEEGPGRIDALGRIGNTVFGDELNSVNYKLGNAPVRYPPLWDIWKFDYVQYNASVRQPMTRNVSESLGTGATAALLAPYGTPIPVKDRFDSSVMMNNLNQLETALWSLEPPRWSEDCLGKIDWVRAKRGQVLFANSCQHCHGPFPASDPIKEWFAYYKASQNKCRVLNSWQSFLNQVYNPATGDLDEGSGQASHAPPPEPKPESPDKGILLSAQERQEASNHVEHAFSFAALDSSMLPKVTGAPGAPSPKPVITTPEISQSAISNPTVQPKPANALPAQACNVTPAGNAPWVGNRELPLWIMHPLTIEEIGTDPTAAVNFLDKKIDLTRMGLVPAGVEAHLRQLMRQDLNAQINAYAKDILRLTRRDMRTVPMIDRWNSAQQAVYQKAALDVAAQAATPADATRLAGNEENAAALQSDIAQLHDALAVGSSRIDNVIDSLDLGGINTGVALSLVVTRARQRFYEERRYEEQARNELNGFGQLDIPRALAQYKPRPLAGIWAAGPFLHNGSVPTIYQLLLPADQRDKKFFVGTRDFDPVNLGLSTQPPLKGGFWLDTSITGNSNIGHEFRKGYVSWKPGSKPQYGVIGPEWSEEDRRDLIEYLKIHRDEHTIDPAKDIDGYLREGLDTSNVCQ
jgi:mono/diheme cytochrome c family protein